MNSADGSSRIVWSLPGRGARLIVDLDAIEGNVATICAAVRPQVRVMAVVKAGGYGEGAAYSARAALAGGASWLGVATVREAVELREAGISAPILVLSATLSSEAETASRYRVALTIGSSDQLERFQSTLIAGLDEPLAVFLKIDTGMHRYGVPPDEAVRAASTIAADSRLNLAGVFTHFARADDADMSSTNRQADIFRTVLDAVRHIGIDPGLVHASNSAAMLRRRDLDFDMVRPGICILGVRPEASISLFAGMRPAVRVEAMIQRVQNLPVGEEVGYGGLHRTTRPTRTGLLSLGYADGYRRGLSERSWVGFNGVKLQEIGRVSMDQTIVEIPGGCDAAYGSVVRVAGDGTAGEPTIEDLATMAGTIPYEILTGLGQRLPVFYVRDGNVVAHHDTK